MKTTEIILIVTALLVLGIRLYRKYTDKKRIGGGDGNRVQGGDSFNTSGKEDEYEPYASKRD